jgi:hypothetical protein
MRHRTANLGRRFVLAQTLINDLAQQVVAGPGEKRAALSSLMIAVMQR